MKLIIKIIKNSCPDSSEINKTIPQELPTAAIHRVREIYNSSLFAGCLPDEWKEATVRLIPKLKKRHQESNKLQTDSPFRSAWQNLCENP